LTRRESDNGGHARLGETEGSRMAHGSRSGGTAKSLRTENAGDLRRKEIEVERLQCAKKAVVDEE